jgi:hypothetical protein
MKSERQGINPKLFPQGSFKRLPRTSIKGEVNKKHLSFGWSFSCLAGHLIKRGRF